MIVAKFGGSSLANAEHFLQVKDILDMDESRRYLVVSAPGRRNDRDTKVTDLLLACDANAKNRQPFDEEFRQLADRFREIAGNLGLPGCLDAELDEVKSAIERGSSRDYVVSRGEFLCAKLVSRWLDIPYIEAADNVMFSEDGKLNMHETLNALREALLPHERAVLPGFYGADSQGNIHTFSRGGSDVSGALAAAAVDADLYENWTDVTGFRSADPRLVPDASYISALTYRELRELSYMGASVMHEDAVFPVRFAGVPTSIRNTLNPHHPGTLITPSPRQIGRLPAVTGIAGKKGFSTIILEKNRMNDEIGFGRKVLAVLERHQVNFEHLPTGVDALCLMISSEALAGKKQMILDEIEEAVHPDSLSVQEGLALVACVGAGLFNLHGTIARLLTAVSEHGIAIRTIFQAPSDLSVILGVNETHLEMAVKAIYDAFIRE